MALKFKITIFFSLLLLNSISNSLTQDYNNEIEVIKNIENNNYIYKLPSEIIVKIINIALSKSSKDNFYYNFIYTLKNLACLNKRINSLIEISLEEYFKNYNKKDIEIFLIKSVEFNYKPLVLFFLKNNANVNTVKKGGISLLMIAASKGFNSILKLLLDYDADINLQDDSGCTTLIYAIISDFPESAMILLKNYANIDLRDNSKCGPLLYAAVKGNKSIVEYLLKNNVNVSLEDSKLLLHFANCDIMDLFIKYGLNINLRDINNQTLLMIAAYFGNNNKVRYFLKNGADINAKDNDGNTSLILATLAGFLSTVKLLIENKADINAKNNDYDTALILAVDMGYLDIVKVLVENGADIKAKNRHGMNALSIADLKINRDIFTFLKNYQNNHSFFMLCK